jgi:hypothetical protein
MNTRLSLKIAPIALLGALVSGQASAQVNCNALPHGPARANCYAQESRIYQRQSQYYNGIAQDQYRQHQQMGGPATGSHLWQICGSCLECAAVYLRLSLRAPLTPDVTQALV